MITINTDKHVKNGQQEDNFSPNVGLIRSEGFRVIRATIPRAVRNELSQAVKTGVLGRLKKEGLKPEVFYHPTYESAAIDAQINIAKEATETLSKVLC